MFQRVKLFTQHKHLVKAFLPAKNSLRSFKIGVQAYKVLHGTAPRYLGPLVRVFDLPGGVVSALPALIAWS